MGPAASPGVSPRSHVVAAINVSPESFHRDSVAGDSMALTEAVLRAQSMGAAMIDIGAMSTAPYREAWVTAEEEARRMRAAIRIVRQATSLPISADTQRAEVAEVALEEGADYINDVSALAADPAMGSVATAARGVILMARGNACLEEGGRRPAEIVRDLLRTALVRAESHGIPPEKIILDPGVGFFRNMSVPWCEFDLEILRNLALFRALGHPLYVGASRKSFLGHLLGREEPADRLAGSLAVAGWCALAGVEWIRVHDVAETMDVIRMMELLSERTAAQ